MRFLSGYDFFVSYSRQDANSYALKVTDYLIHQGYTCYIDKWGTEPGKQLPVNLKKIIKNASVMIIIGSPCSEQSQAIAEEIDIFLKTRRMIIPVDLEGMRSAIWWSKIEGLALTQEPLDSLSTDKEIGQELKDRVKGSLTYTKQAIRIRNFLITAVSIFMLTVIFVSYLSLNIRSLKSRQKSLQEENIQIDHKRDEEQRKNDSLTLKNTSQTLQNDSLKKSAILLANNIIKNKKQLDSIKIKMGLFKTGNTSLVTLLMHDFACRTVEYPSNWPIPFIVSKEKPLRIYQNQDKIKLDPLVAKAVDEFIHAWQISGDNRKIQIDDDYGGSYINTEEEVLVAENPEMNAAYSLKISQQFAQSIVDYFISKGVPKNKIIAKAFGNSRIINKISLLNNKAEIYTLENNESNLSQKKVQVKK